MIVPPLAAALIQNYGWRVADLTFGAGCLFLLACCALIAVPPPIAKGRVTGSVRQIVVSRAFLTLYVSWLCATTALLLPLVFLPAFAREHGAGPIAASALVSLLGGMSVLGRVGIGVLANRIGTLRLFKLSVLIMGASYGLQWGIVFALTMGALGFAVIVPLRPR